MCARKRKRKHKRVRKRGERRRRVNKVRENKEEKIEDVNYADCDNRATN